MADLSAFPITKTWPPHDSNRVQLYSLTTPLDAFLGRPAVARGLEIPRRGD